MIYQLIIRALVRWFGCMMHEWNNRLIKKRPLKNLWWVHVRLGSSDISFESWLPNSNFFKLTLTTVLGSSTVVKFIQDLALSPVIRACHNEYALYTLRNLHFCHQKCIHWDLFCTHYLSIAYLSVMGDGSVLCRSSWWFLPFFSPVKAFLGEFFLIWVKGLSTEAVVCCADCKATWGELWFVILDYKNKLDLTWLSTGSSCNHNGTEKYDFHCNGLPFSSSFQRIASLHTTMLKKCLT